MIFDGTDEIERSNLVYKVGTAMTESEREISFTTLTNNIASSHLPFMNGVSMIFSKIISSR
jgi:hypothetical protein